jgi:benzoyl-CoA reductase/2-hydroxyglutaryl-CoA dehydratase subunit BcrC/BadD/HgdB
MERFRHAAETLENDSIRAWKAGGGKVVGYSCSFIPEEIITAAGLLPFRLRGVGTSSVSIGDSYFGPVNCSLPKCMLQLAGQGSYAFLDGAIISNGCDSMRRLEECWRKAADDHPGTLPGYYEYFSVPHKAVDYSIDFYTQELGGMIKTIEKHFGVEITPESLKKALSLHNRGRALLKRLDAIRWRDEVPVTGEDAMAILIAGHAMPLAEWLGMLESLLGELENAPPVSAGKKRLMLVGSANDDVSFIRLIEEGGALVVADTVCFGSRTYASMVDETSEPVHSLASHYLSNSICPRMLGSYKERRAFITGLARDARADGIILQNVRFCDLHGSENGVLERDLEETGIPCMRLEREYGPLVETGRIRMRLDAFMERIS